MLDAVTGGSFGHLPGFEQETLPPDEPDEEPMTPLDPVEPVDPLEPVEPGMALPQLPAEHVPLALQLPADALQEMDSVAPLRLPEQLVLVPSASVPLSETLLPLTGPERRVPAEQEIESEQLDWLT